MRILLTGACGTLAHSLLSADIPNEYLKIDIRDGFNNVIKNDLTYYPSIKTIVHNYQPEYVFHFAALTDIDYCEMNKFDAVDKNYVSTRNVVDVCSDLDIPLVFISSACVFNGESGFPYKETDKTDPANFHGLTKLLAERYIQERLKRFIILRIGWLMGNPRVDRKFVGKTYAQLLSKTQHMYGVSDLRGTLTFADDLIRKIFQLISKNQAGIFHYGAGGSASRYEIMSRLIRQLGWGDRIRLTPVPHSHFELIAKRPRNEILENRALQKLGLDSPAGWEEHLDIYVRHYFHDCRNEII